MKPLKTVTAVVFLVTFVFILFSTLHLDRSRRAKSDALRFRSLTVHEGEVKASTQARVTAPNPQRLSVHDRLRQTIPQNGAYWNRLLYTAIKQLENGEIPVSRDSEWSRCREWNQELLKTIVDDLLKYPPVLQIMNCRSPPLLINQPDKCLAGEGEGHNQTVLVFGIKSLPGHSEQRQVVRKSWAREGLSQNGLRVHTVFLLGSSSQDDRDLDPLLSFESQYFGDIL